MVSVLRTVKNILRMHHCFQSLWRFLVAAEILILSSCGCWKPILEKLSLKWNSALFFHSLYACDSTKIHLIPLLHTKPVGLKMFSEQGRIHCFLLFFSVKTENMCKIFTLNVFSSRGFLDLYSWTSSIFHLLLHKIAKCSEHPFIQISVRWLIYFHLMF